MNRVVVILSVWCWVLMQVESPVSSETETLLSLRSVSKHFPIRSGFFNRVTGAVQAVNDVSLDVIKGETLGIVGESGCGKSTLARCILQLVRPTAGEVLFENQELTALSEKNLRPLRREFQMVFQNPYASLDPRMTVESILLEPFEVHRLYSSQQRQKEVQSLLDMVGLSTGVIQKFPHELSGGQCQRVGVARALALRPKLIIADEAVSALDVSIQAQILNLMQDLKSAFNLTYIFISHNLSVVEYISDRVAVMYLGQVVELAPSSALYHHPQHPYTKALLSAIPKPDPADRDRPRLLLEGDLPSPANPPSGCRFHTRCPAATALCQSVPPVWEETAPNTGHFVACHHFRELSSLI